MHRTYGPCKVEGLRLRPEWHDGYCRAHRQRLIRTASWALPPSAPTTGRTKVTAMNRPFAAQQPRHEIQGRKLADRAAAIRKRLDLRERLNDHVRHALGHLVEKEEDLSGNGHDTNTRTRFEHRSFVLG